MGVCTKERKGVTAEVLRATPCTNSLGGESGEQKAAVDVDVGPERRSPRYHGTCLALESVKQGSAAVSEPRCVWLRVHIFKDLEKARRLE